MTPDALASELRSTKAFFCRSTACLTEGDAWVAPLPEGPVMGGAARFAIVSGINDHTAHHRGPLPFTPVSAVTAGDALYVSCIAPRKKGSSKSEDFAVPRMTGNP